MRTYGGLVSMLGAAAFAASVFGGASAAQSDGSLEEAYAAQCPQHQDNQVCNTLRNAMKSAATGVPATPKRAALGVGVTALPPALYSNLLLAPGNGSLVESVIPDGAAAKAGIAQNDVLIAIGGTPITADKQIWDILIRYAVGQGVPVTLIRNGQKKTVNVVLMALVSPVDDPSLHTEQIAARSGVLAEMAAQCSKGQANEVCRASRTANAQVAADETWGVLPQLAGTMWRRADGHGDKTWRFRWLQEGQKYQIMIYHDVGVYDRFYELERKPNGRLFGKGNFGSEAFWGVILPGGAVYFDQSDDALIPTGADEFEWQDGRIRSGQYVPTGKADAAYNGRYRRLDDAEQLKFAQVIGKANEVIAEQAAARAAAKAQRGDSGLFGALAMATGAALAGGNAEMVYGAAMKGAELTTSNEGLRSGLAGQGDAMMLAGADRRATDVAQHNARVRAAQAQAEATRARQTPGAPQTANNIPGGNGAIVVANATPPVRPAAAVPRAVAPPVKPSFTYYDCRGVTKKKMPDGSDGWDTIFYGIVTSSRPDIEGAKNLFRQHTGSRGWSNTEDVGTGCHPYTTRGEAQGASNGAISRDSRGGWRQVPGIELSM